MVSTRNITDEAALIILRNQIIVFSVVKFEKHDDLFDYGTELSSSFLEWQDGSIHHSIAHAINNVYDLSS